MSRLALVANYFLVTCVLTVQGDSGSSEGEARGHGLPPAKFVMQAILTQLGANSATLDLRLSDNFHRLMLLMSVLSSEELMCTDVMFCGHCVHAIIVVFV